ncbi:hypothetical protein H6G66_19555 [Fischerella sp. FACHB-380]|nr:hypothetical protein [Fischerella sp. FACHB-380]
MILNCQIGDLLVLVKYKSPTSNASEQIATLANRSANFLKSRGSDPSQRVKTYVVKH